MIRYFQKILPPVYTAIFILLMIVWQLTIPFKLPIFLNLFKWIGILIIIFSLLVIIQLTKQFCSAKTPIRPFTETTTLITNGLYRFSRNPIYLAFIILLIGEALILNNFILLIFPLILAIILQKAFIQKEEELLRIKFPQEYPQYCKKVRRWL